RSASIVGRGGFLVPRNQLSLNRGWTPYIRRQKAGRDGPRLRFAPVDRTLSSRLNRDAAGRRPEDIPARTCYERPAVSIKREGAGAERWGWDLNPRGGCPPSGFRDRRPRPD